MQDYPISIAPMMDYSDRHFRMLMRFISSQTLLYSEMVTTGAILHGQRDKYLAFDRFEKPVVLQLGGSDPQALAECARIGTDYGYDQINLNVGCPSDRVQRGRFGACLMKEAQLVAECVAAMRAVVEIPVTVKTRLGVDDQDSYDLLMQFITCVGEAGCETFIMHARKAWLKGLNPKQNRTVPPLRYDWVLQLQQNFPQLNFILNGGITSLSSCVALLKQHQGIMLGRAAVHHPYLLAQLDEAILGSDYQAPTRSQVLKQYQNYATEKFHKGINRSVLIKPILGLYRGQPGGRAWRRRISEALQLQQDRLPTLLEPC